MSNETKWTKGPWVRGRYGSIEDANGEIVEATGLAIATGYRDPSDPAFANAHLIAAAPDGAKLAELVMEICGDPQGISEAGQDVLYETALQFMRKARGETS